MAFLTSVGFGTATIVGYGKSIGRPIKDNAYNAMFWLQTLFSCGQVLDTMNPNRAPKSAIGVAILALPFLNMGIHIMGQSTGRVAATVFGPTPSSVAIATDDAARLA